MASSSLPLGSTGHPDLDWRRPRQTFRHPTHKHEKVRSWIKWRNQRHRKAHGVERIELHFTPTSSSWMNLVERVFRDLTVDCVPLASDELTLMHKAASLGHLCPRDAVTFFGSSRATAYRRLQHL